MKNILKQGAVNGFWNTLSNFKAGSYYWKVSALNKKGKAFLVSRVQAFSVLPNLTSPVAVYPKQGQMVDMVDKNTLQLKWQKLNGADYYEIELFQKKNGVLQSIYSKETKGNTSEFKNLKKLDIGTFVWTIQGIDTQGRRVIRRSPIKRNEFQVKLGEINKDYKFKFKTDKKIIVE